MPYLDESGVTRFARWVKDNFVQLTDLAAVATTGDYDDLSGRPAAATTATEGLMSAADKAKLDGIEAGAQVNVNVEFDVEATTDTASEITAWSAGSAPTLGTPIAATNITSWDAGSAATLGTAIEADNITSWNSGTAASMSVSSGVLTLNSGVVPTLTFADVTIPNVTGTGTAPALAYDNASIPNVTDVGAVPSLAYAGKTVVADVTVVRDES